MFNVSGQISQSAKKERARRREGRECKGTRKERGERSSGEEEERLGSIHKKKQKKRGLGS